MLQTGPNSPLAPGVGAGVVAGVVGEDVASPVPVGAGVARGAADGVGEGLEPTGSCWTIDRPIATATTAAAAVASPATHGQPPHPPLRWGVYCTSVMTSSTKSWG